jgi:hypothetical protein
LPEDLEVVLVLRSERSGMLPLMEPSMVFKHRRLVALCRVWLLEIFDITVVILLPALPGGEPGQYQLRPLFFLP